MPYIRGEKGKRSKERLLRAAAKEFADKGYHGAKISSIVAHAEMTQPAFYIYFRSKESVFTTLVAEFRMKCEEVIGNSRLEAGIEAKDLSYQIEQNIERIFAFFAEESDLTQICLKKAKEAEEIRADIVTMFYENMLSDQKEGYLKQDVDMRIAAESLLGVMERLTFTHLLNEEESPRSLARQVVQIFLEGIGVRG